MATQQIKRTRFSARRCGARVGFTLTEVMISIALVLIVILGVNQVFALTGKAIGAGQALSTINRDARDAQYVICNDLAHAEIDRAPFFAIKSEVFIAFRNRADQLGDHDFNITSTTTGAADTTIRTVDRNRNGVDSDVGDQTPRVFLTSRTHRADTLKFFTRTLARRQTGDVNSYTTGVGSTEQHVCYGHLKQPANDGNIRNGHLPGITPSSVSPGGGTQIETPISNPNNYYASSWVLGRTTFILREPEVISSNHVIRDFSTNVSGVNVAYVARSLSPSATSTAPFAEGSGISTTGSVSTAQQIQWSYYDVMGIGMDNGRAAIKRAIDNGSTTWFNNMDFRFTGFPMPTRPLTREGVSRTVPCFVNHCTQFAVEYAGDFICQDPSSGDLVADANFKKFADGDGHGTDGQIDFVVDSTGKRSIRWYGFPRDTNGDGVINKNDVVPLRDITGTALPFERRLPTTNISGNYAVNQGSQAVPAGGSYYTVWGPDTANYPRPKMIRITLAIDDPAQRVGDEKFFEYVVTLP